MSEAAEARLVDLDRAADARFDNDDDAAPVVPHGFVIDTEAKAEWAAELVLRSEAEIERRAAQLKRLVADDDDYDDGLTVADLLDHEPGDA